MNQILIHFSTTLSHSEHCRGLRLVHLLILYRSVCIRRRLPEVLTPDFFSLIVYDLVCYSKSLIQYLMSLTVQCRLLCKTLKAVDIFCIPYFDVKFSSWRQSCPCSSYDRYFSVETEGWLHTVPFGKTISSCERGLLCQAVVNQFPFFSLSLFCCGPEDNFESSSSQPENKCKDVNILQKIDNWLFFLFFTINLRLLSLKAKNIAVANRT